MLRHGVPAFYRDNRTKKARRYVRHFRTLQAEFTLSSPLALTYAAAVADTWVKWEGIRIELEDLEHKRTTGRGRRPNASAIERLRRRAGLEWKAYEGALGRLASLAGKSDHKPTSGADLVQLHRVATTP
jgi:hypothetical protein